MEGTSYMRNEGRLTGLVTSRVTYCLLKHVTLRREGKRRQERKCKQLLNGIKETRGYWKLKEEALDRTPWSGPVIRQTSEGYTGLNVSGQLTKMENLKTARKQCQNMRMLFRLIKMGY